MSMKPSTPKRTKSRPDSFVLVPTEGINPMSPVQSPTVPESPKQFPRIFVGGIPKEVTSEQLVAWFHKYGLEIIELPRVLSGKKFGYAPNVLLRTSAQYKRAIAMERIPMGEYLLDVRAHRSNMNPNNKMRATRAGQPQQQRQQQQRIPQHILEHQKNKKEASMIEHHCRVLESKIQQLKVKEAEYILGKQKIEKKIEEYKIALHMQRVRQHQHSMKMQNRRKALRAQMKKDQAAQAQAQAAQAQATQVPVPMPTGENVYKHVYGDILISPQEPSPTPENEKLDSLNRAEQQLIKQIRKMTFEKSEEMKACRDAEERDERQTSLKKLETDLEETLSKVRQRLTNSAELTFTNLNSVSRESEKDAKDAVAESDQTMSLDELRGLQKSFEMRDSSSSGKLIMLVKDNSDSTLPALVKDKYTETARITAETLEDMIDIQPLEDDENAEFDV